MGKKLRFTEWNFRETWENNEGKNGKTNYNIANYHLVSRRVISAPLNVQRVYRCSKRTFILPQKYHVSVLHMLL